MKPTLLLAAMLALPLAAHAHGEKKHAPAPAAAAEQTTWGIAGKPAEANRTVVLEMGDGMRFSPEDLSLEEGDIVRFVVKNRGRMLHEVVIGTSEELAKHAAMMARFPNMEHDEPYLAHVGPGQAGEIVWHFNRAGAFEFACLIPGHYEAGMRGTLNVTPKKGEAK